MTKQIQEVELTKEQLEAMMEEQMSVSWEQLDNFFRVFTNSSSPINTKAALREDWLTNKLPLFKLFGNKLRMEREVELSITDRDVRSALEGFLDSLVQNPEMTDTTIGSVLLLVSSVKTDVIVSNRFDDKFELLDMKFNAGMKFSRALGQLTKNEREKYHIQTEFSKIAQTFKAVGTLVVSIDPVDIIMMSHNPDNDWRSCHDITSGEYRAGALSYATDTSTFISYAYRRKGETYGDIEVPNKLWRQIGYVSDDRSAIALSTHYPNWNSSNEETLANLLKEAFPESQRETVDAEESLHFDNLGGYHYNDLINGRTDESLVIDLFNETGKKGESFTRFLRDNRFTVGNEELQSVYEGYGRVEDCDEI